AAAHELGLEAPVNETLWRLIKAMVSSSPSPTTPALPALSKVEGRPPLLPLPTLGEGGGDGGGR
ncbi:MAG TPA: hypothetical protein VJ768_04600, partial [Anaerolineales bacterium]|nr:hypothetical protein [Anaerolineales bacterium]